MAHEDKLTPVDGQGRAFEFHKLEVVRLEAETKVKPHGGIDLDRIADKLENRQYDPDTRGPLTVFERE